MAGGEVVRLVAAMRAAVVAGRVVCVRSVCDLRLIDRFTKPLPLQKKNLDRRKQNLNTKP